MCLSIRKFTKPPGKEAPPLCDIPSGCCSFTGPWTVTRSSLCMLRRVAAFCRPLRPVLLLVSSPRSWIPVVGVLGLCWMWRDVPVARQRRPVVGVLGLCWLLRWSFDWRPPPSPPIVFCPLSHGLREGFASNTMHCSNARVQNNTHFLLPKINSGDGTSGVALRWVRQAARVHMCAAPLSSPLQA